ncbi:MAG TPA: hypothetical protein VF189_00160, partial [Patescibacteria group bacterium]
IASTSAAIKAGDYLTSSDIAGKAMKATHSGQTIGKALEDWDPASGKTSVLTFVTVAYADPNNILKNIKTDDNGNLLVSNISTASIALPQDLTIGNATISGTLTDALTAISDHIATAEANLSILSTSIIDLNSKVDQLSQRVDNLETSQASESAKIVDVLLKSNALSDSVASSTASISALTDQINQILTSNQAFIASTSAELGLDNNMQINTATVSGTLNVLGRTTLNDLGVTGTFTTGLLSIHGLNDDGTASINTLTGNLKLQDNSLGGLDILSGKVVIDPNGNVNIKESLNAKVVNTEKINITTTDNQASSSAVLSASAGVATIVSGTDSVTINTKAVTGNSLIYITFTDDYSPATRYWIAAKNAGNSFTVKLDIPVLNNAKFSWWIVN